MSDPEQTWAAEMLYGSERSAAPPTQLLTTSEKRESSSGPAELEPAGETAEPDNTAPETPHPDVNAGAKETAVVLGGALLAAVAVIVAALVTSSDPATPTPAATPPVAVRVAPVPSSAPTPPESDQAIAYTASADCPPGSTAAQALSDTTSDSAWVCVRGAAGARVDGQVLRIDLHRSYVISAVSVTPGWVAKTPGGKDEWLGHRVVSRLQYIFNDDERTVFTQDTGNAHGPVTTALPKKIVASRVTVVILQTARPPVSPLPTVGPTAADQPDFGDSMLGPDAAPLTPDATATTDPAALGEPDSDPVDATFAMSMLKILGHQPS